MELTGKLIKKIEINELENCTTEIIHIDLHGFTVWVTIREDKSLDVDINCHQNKPLQTVKKTTKHREYNNTDWRRTKIEDGKVEVRINDFK